MRPVTTWLSRRQIDALDMLALRMRLTRKGIPWREESRERKGQRFCYGTNGKRYNLKKRRVIHEYRIVRDDMEE